MLEGGVVSEQGSYAILVSPFALSRWSKLTMQSRREGSRFRTLMAAQLLLEQSGDKRREASVASAREKERIELANAA